MPVFWMATTQVQEDDEQSQVDASLSISGSILKPERLMQTLTLGLLWQMQNL